jgi:RNA polymerase sigma-70 factor (ECF subfamily)
MSGTIKTPSEQDKGLESLDDALLIKRIAERDRRAFDVFYRRYHRRVFRFVVRKVRSEALAEEIAGDSMMAVWQGAASFEGASTVSTWLLGIAYRQALRAMTRDRRHSMVESDEEAVAVVPDLTVTRPESRAMADNDRSVLRHGVESLADHHRVVVELSASGHSYSEIASITGCNENTVRTRMFHARQHLKRFLARVSSEGKALFSREPQPEVGRPFSAPEAATTWS